MLTPRNFQTLTLLSDGTALAAGGINGTTVLSTAEIYGSPIPTATPTAHQHFDIYLHADCYPNPNPDSGPLNFMDRNGIAEHWPRRAYRYFAERWHRTCGWGG